MYLITELGGSMMYAVVHREFFWEGGEENWASRLTHVTSYDTVFKINKLLTN